MKPGRHGVCACARRFSPIAILVWALASPVAGSAQSHPAPGAPINPALVASPWPGSHGGPAQQASTALRGPESAEPHVQLRFFAENPGIAFGTSPWHVLSNARYEDGRSARTVWGATLTHLYKYRIDGEAFDYVDSFELNSLPVWIGWNLFGLADGRIVVPNPSGLRLRQYRDQSCYGKEPALLVFRDGATSDSPIECVGKFEFTRDIVETACGFRKLGIGSTAVITGVTYTGEIAVSLVNRRARNSIESWLAIVDNDLQEILACRRVGDSGISNMFPVERVSASISDLYLATDSEVVTMRYDSLHRELSRLAAVETQYRQRTGTTPTLLGFADDRWLISVDARCAVTRVFSGRIECTDDTTGPSTLVALPRPLGSGPAVTVPLPGFIDTVENSPAVAGNDIVIANYSGYTPDGKKDGRKDRATGVVKMSWNPTTDSFQTDWMNPDIQISGVPTISASSNLVYGSGSETDGFTYFYGLRLKDDAAGPGGELVVRSRVGRSTPSSRKAKDAVYDAGNNILINDDGSAIWPGGEVLVRIIDPLN